MMNKKEIIAKLAAVMATLLETTADGGSSPASSIYLAFNHDIDAYQTIVGVGERMGWLRVKSESLGLTPAGRERAKAFATLFSKPVSA